jgi:glycine/D-amino acid oxidase-like deaminating enzyme
MAESQNQHRVVIVGAGFAGFNAARELARLAGASTEIVVINSTAAAANPLHVPLSGPVANAVTRGYHLTAMSGNRMRVLTDWILNATTPSETTSLPVISAESVPLDVNNPGT